MLMYSTAVLNQRKSSSNGILSTLQPIDWLIGGKKSAFRLIIKKSAPLTLMTAASLIHKCTNRACTQVPMLVLK